jgi:hypothetical protein
MDEVSMIAGAAIGILIVGWMGWITYRIETTSSSADDVFERFDGLEEALSQSLGYLMEKVKGIEEIKEFIPSFSINQSPLQPLIEHILGNLGSGGSNAASDLGRDESGQFTPNKGEITDGETEI